MPQLLRWVFLERWFSYRGGGEALEQLAGLLAPAKPDWKRPGEIAAELGVTPNRVGRAISELGIRGKEGLSMTVLDKSPHSPKTVTSHLYSQEAVGMIREHLVEQGHVEGEDGVDEG